SAANRSKEIRKNIGKRISPRVREIEALKIKSRILTTRPGLPAFSQKRSVLIILGAFLGIGKDRVGLRQSFELLFRFLVAGIQIGVIFSGELLVGFFEFFGGCFLANAEHLVKIFFDHRLSFVLCPLSFVLRSTNDKWRMTKDKGLAAASPFKNYLFLLTS